MKRFLSWNFVRTLFDDDPAKTSIHVRCISESLKSFEKNLWKDAMNDDVLLQSIKLDYTKITVVQILKSGFEKSK